MTEQRSQYLYELIQRQSGIIRSSLFRQSGIDSREVLELLRSGMLIKLKDGYYVTADEMENLSDYQIITQTIPGAVICFISAAAIYGFTTVIPDAIHVTVQNNGKCPVAPLSPPTEIVLQKAGLYNYGRTILETEFGTLPIYDRERTVCDCLKRNSEIGMDVFIEVIRNYMRGPKNLQNLYATADKLQIRNKLSPYVEALV